MNKLTIYDKAQEDLREVDIYRDSAIRFLGYANEIGEAFRSLVPVNVVRLSYIVSIGYVLSDTADKSRRTYQLNYVDTRERSRAVAFRAMDTLIWQSLASVVIPGFTINRVCYLSNKFLNWILGISYVSNPMQRRCLFDREFIIMNVTVTAWSVECIRQEFRSTKWPLKVRKLASTLLGLCTIPFIVKPIDTAVEIGMKSSIRKFHAAVVFKK